MKKNLLLLTTLLSLFFTSCQFTEEITFNKNGSGHYNLKVDMSQMLKGMSGLKEKDSLQKKPEKVDSTIYFKDILTLKKDSIAKLSASDQAILHAIKDLKLHINMDEEKEIMVMDYAMNFREISQINAIQEKMEKAQQLQDNKAKKDNITDHEVQYIYSKHQFQRKVVMKELSEEDRQKFEDNQSQYGMFMNGSTFKLIYNFPKKIKKVSYPDVSYANNHKSLIIEVSMDSLTKNPKLLDFQVEF